LLKQVPSATAARPGRRGVPSALQLPLRRRRSLPAAVYRTSNAAPPRGVTLCASRSGRSSPTRDFEVSQTRRPRLAPSRAPGPRRPGPAAGGDASATSIACPAARFRIGPSRV